MQFLFRPNTENNVCEPCGDLAQFTSQPVSLAMAYVPVQCWEQIYEPDTGLTRGTIFPDLDKPFIGEEAVPGGRG